MAISGIKLAVGTGAVTRADMITQGDFSLAFDRDVLHCETVDGVIHIHSNGAEITDYAPGEATIEGSLTQRFSKNVAVWFGANGQGVDARVPTYSAGKVTALPHAPNPNDSVILQDAAPKLEDTIRKGTAEAWAAFQFTDALPAPGRFSGPIGWWNLKAATTYDIDLDAKLAALPSLSMAGVDYPPVSDVLERLDRYWGFALLTPGDVSGQGYEAWVPQGSMDGLAFSNYGEYLAILIGAASSHLIGDVATTDQKRRLLIRLVEIGKEVLEGGRAVGQALGGPADTGMAGHTQWEFIPVVAYLWARDLEDDLDNLRTLMPTNILGQPFYWTAGLIAQLAPHDNVNNICISRRRQITAVSGTSITYVTSSAADAPRTDTRTLIMTRESDGAMATVINVVDTQTNPGTHQVTINAQPGLPFQVDDVIYFHSPHTIADGDVDWRVFQANKVINPSAEQDYRNQQMWLEEILFPHALGIWRSDWNAARDYVLRCMDEEDPAGFPAPWSDRSLYTIGGTSHQFDKSMWDAHAASYGLA